MFIRLLKYTAGLILLGCISILLLFSLVYVGFFGSLPSNEKLKLIENEEASLIYSSDQVIIGKVFAQNRTNIKPKQIPDYLKKALVATEDRRFYTHEGYDGRSYLRVLLRSILMLDKSGGGGSTITQQLIKNIYGRRYSGILNLPVNKIKELIVATRLEEIYTKDEILVFYLNSVPFGEDIYGVESAANRYFNKSVNNLSVEEAAVLVGMLKANTYYNPRLNPKNAENRRNTVLELMNSEQYLSDEATDSLQKIPLNLNYKNLNTKSTAGYFVYQVKKQTTEILKSINKKKSTNYNLETDGLKIYTTLNYTLQKIAEKAAKDQLIAKQKKLDRELQSNRIKYSWLKKQERKSKALKADRQNRTVELFNWDKSIVKNCNTFDSLWHYAKMLNASVLITNPKNGAVVTWVGGNNFRALPFDMVLSHRQIASTFKPILYATAIENGFSPCTYLENKEKSFKKYKNWEPHNADYSSTSDSAVALWYALAHSMNLPSIDLYFKLGRELLINSCRKFELPKIIDDAPSVALGTLDVSLLEITKAYGAFANKGKMNNIHMIRKITDKDGKVIYERKAQKAKRVVSMESCQTLTAILQEAVNQGTGSKIRNVYGIKSPLAGKTGTAQNYTDAWFVAYTPSIVLGSWVGASNHSIHFSSGEGSGSSLALPIIAKILREIERDPSLRKQYLRSFDIPQEVYTSIECTEYKEKGIKGFLKRLFNKRIRKRK